MSADLAPYRCDAAEARELVTAWHSTVERGWQILLRAHEGRAWAVLGYASWREFAAAELNVSQSRAYQLLDMAKVVREIEAAAGSTSVELTEAAARDLKPHLAEVVADVEAAVADLPEADRPAAAARAVKDARARLTTTRTTEATKVEQDVDLATGEIIEPTAPQTAPAPVAPQDAGASYPSNPLAAARAEVARQPAIVAGKGIERLRTARLTFEAAGTPAEVIADLVNDGLDVDRGHDWLAELDAALPLLSDFAAALRRRNLRSVRNER